MVHHRHRRIVYLAVRNWSQISDFKETAQPITDLGRIFDSPTFWDRHRLTQATTSTGLFGYDQLASSQRQGFVQAAKSTVEHVNHIISLVCAEVSSVEEKRKAVKRLDLLSDLVCSVVDAAQLIMSVHPDPKVSKDAATAHAILSNFLSHLNTNTPLYLALKRTMDDPEIKRHMTTQEIRVGELLLQDFEKSGIHMPKARKETFIALNDKIRELGHEFIAHAYPSSQSFWIESPDKELEGLPRHIAQALQRRSERGGLNLPTASPITHALLRDGRNEDTRRKAFLALNSGNENQISVLERMLKCRSSLAQLLGRRNYAELYLSDKMAGSPGHVLGFLEPLAELHKPIARHAFQQLQLLKDKDSLAKSTPLQPWDIQYYANRAMQLSDHSHDLVLSSYLSVGRAFEMLSYVLSSLFGITLQPASCLPGETWHNEVRKVEVHHELHGKIGTVYCDLFQRRAEESGKMDHPAHFTVRCSRVLEDDDLVPNQGSPAMKNMSDFALLPDPVTGELRRYQLPIVVLVTGFKRPQSELNPSNLSFLELETVFHEMGHAVHSMLARTEFQHVSGTRVPMDFVEVASIFMEYFAKNPHVICRFAKHHGSGVPLSPTAFQSAVLEPKIQDIIDRQNQLQLSILDHKYHSTPEPVDTTQVLADIQNQYHVISYTKNTSWQVQFSHLFTYGAGYYTYAWSKRWASRLHTHLLKDKSPHEWREAGELINRELLAPGGSRSPWIGLQRIGIVKQGESKGRYSDPKLEDLGILSNRKD